MEGRKSTGNQGTKMQDTIDFLRESALVKEISGMPALTSKGERFLQALQDSSPRSIGGSNPPDGSSFSEGTNSR
jgi:hypothetical protein